MWACGTCPASPRTSCNVCWPDGRSRRHFGLTASEVYVVVVGGQTIGQLICTILALTQRGTVKQQMVVSGVFFLGSRWSDPHAAEAKDNRDRLIARCHRPTG